MNISDDWVKAILVFCIIIYLATFAGGLITHKLLQYVLVLNALSGLVVVIYWVQKQLRITQHIFEEREMIFLGFEVAVIALAVYGMRSSHVSQWLRIIQYICFTLQFIFLIALFLFFLFFKMNKLI